MTLKHRITAILILGAGLFLGYFDYASEYGNRFSNFPFELGLDLRGGTHLIYEADLSLIADSDIDESLESLRDVIERRVNIFGVSEPLVQVEEHRSVSVMTGRLIVELPGVTDVDEAISLIGATPVLDFRIENRDVSVNEVLSRSNQEENILNLVNELYVPSGLSGRHLDNATLQFNQLTGEPVVALQFNKEGSDLFQELTSANIGRTIAIYLDGNPISTPVVQQAIDGGQAQITGRFTVDEAQALVRRLNAGALPIPISLLQTQTIGASLGEEAVERGVRAGMIGLLLVGIFMIFWYRVSGLLAVLSLGFYLVFMFALFKLIPVTLTAAGIAGLILSIGLAIDANVLIFERLKEELGKNRKIEEALNDAFSRAWPSIRDSNLSSIITAIILFWFGTSLIKGFALTFGIGVMVSMFSAIVFTRALIFSFGVGKENRSMKLLLGSGLRK